jgi:hypothetical protein
MPDYHIVEHPYRGCLTELDPATMAGGRFSLLCDRNEAMKFPAVEDALAAIGELSPVVAARCDVRRSSVDWPVVKAAGPVRTVIHLHGRNVGRTSGTRSGAVLTDPPQT